MLCILVYFPLCFMICKTGPEARTWHDPPIKHIIPVQPDRKFRSGLVMGQKSKIYFTYDLAQNVLLLLHISHMEPCKNMQNHKVQDFIMIRHTVFAQHLLYLSLCTFVCLCINMTFRMWQVVVVPIITFLEVIVLVWGAPIHWIYGTSILISICHSVCHSRFQVKSLSVSCLKDVYKLGEKKLTLNIVLYVLCDPLREIVGL